MYAVVGCSNCGALWVVEGRPETTGCPRCGRRHRYAALKRFVTTDDRDHAREVRAAMLADRSGHGEAYADLPSVSEMEADAEADVITDEEYLDASGVDAEAVAAAGDRTERGPGRGTRTREEVVRAALRDLDAPTEAAVVAYAADDGVPEAYTERLLAKLLCAGEVSESGGVYRLV